MARPASDLSISALEKLLAKSRRETARLLKVRQKLQAKIEVLDNRIRAIGGSPGSRSGTRARNAVSLVEAITKVLEKADGPLKVGEIMQKVLATGYRSNSENFRGVINQTLIKEKKFKSAARGTYRLGTAPP